MDCIFCKIAKREIPSQDIYEDERMFAFLDVDPRATGHTMVVPKAHVENILALDESDMQPLLSAVKRVTSELQRSLNPDGFTIGINHGAASGQAVAHLHIHIIPRWSADGGGSIHSVVHNPPKESVEEVRKKIVNGR